MSDLEADANLACDQLTEVLNRMQQDPSLTQNQQGTASYESKLNLYSSAVSEILKRRQGNQLLRTKMHSRFDPQVRSI